MALIYLSSEEFADRMEEMFDLVDKGDEVFFHHEGKTFMIIPASDEELAMIEKKKAL